MWAKFSGKSCCNKESAQFFRGLFRQFFRKEMTTVERSAIDITRPTPPQGKRAAHRCDQTFKGLHGVTERSCQRLILCQPRPRWQKSALYPVEISARHRGQSETPCS